MNNETFIGLVFWACLVPELLTFLSFPDLNVFLYPLNKRTIYFFNEALGIHDVLNTFNFPG